jgi:N-acetylglucosaminyldiphosphoundecaprenol N-acetyl-beta-D-mannosaminyltransferase
MECHWSGFLGCYSPPFSDEFSDEENRKIIENINRVKPQVLWVGLTAPKQEKWIHKNLEQLDVQIAVGIGAAFDFISGQVRRAPRWIQKIGLEWLDRTLKEPKRLWRRYLVGNSLFVWLVMKEFFRIKILKKRPKKRII